MVGWVGRAGSGVLPGAMCVARGMFGTRCATPRFTAFAVARAETIGMRRIVVVLAVGAAFRIERRIDCLHGGAEALQHVDDDMVIADENAIRVNFSRKMPVAEMPGEPRQQQIGRAHV